MTDERPRFPVGQRFRYRVSGSTWTILRDWHPHPNVAKTAGITDDRYYVVDGPNGASVMFHGLLEGPDVEPIDDEAAPTEDGTP
ncbi:hypothetical protein AB0L41_42725 [Amycolatopsis mediterranei]|uniref:hypothetical protein n=1 Tax=Amycolatopsis mediterranei TaxID=33910 RepID=UPI00341686D9